MKKFIRILTIVAVLVATVCCLSACDTWDSPYSKLAEQGYDVTIHFDTTGGKVSGNEGTVINDVYTTEGRELNKNGNVEILLYAPDSLLRGQDVHGDPKVKIRKDNHTLIGWYTHRELRYDENGNPLDEYGRLVSETGRPQGYIYSGYWDFTKDKLEVDPNEERAEGEYALTLYAAWAPIVTYEIYAEKADGSFEKYTEVEKIILNMPKWDTDTGKMDLNYFPITHHYTNDELGLILGAYYDKDGLLVQGEDSEYASGTIATKIFTKQDLPNGTDFAIEKGWQLSIVRYTADGKAFIEENVKTSFTINDSFWKWEETETDEEGNETVVAVHDCTSVAFIISIAGHNEIEENENTGAEANKLVFKPITDTLDYIANNAIYVQSPTALENDTFGSASLDPSFSTLIEGSAPGAVNLENGTLDLSGGNTIKVYTKWLKGEWFRVETVKHLRDNAKANGNYIIAKDIDFKNGSLPSVFTREGSVFEGQIIGNGHTISNIKVYQYESSKGGAAQGGLFYELGSNAKIENLNIENATYVITQGTIRVENSYGLLAGVIQDGASLEGLTLSGKIILDKDFNTSNASYNIGLLCGNYIETGIDISNITCEADEAVGITVTVQNDAIGTVILSRDGKSMDENN